MHGAKLIPRQAAVLPCVRLRHVHNAKRLLVVQERRPLGREIAADFAPGDFRSWSGGGHDEATSGRADVSSAVCFGTGQRLNCVSYSPSAMHSNSSTCPLNTVLELKGPDGMRNEGFLSSAGAPRVAHSEKNTTLLH